MMNHPNNHAASSMSQTMGGSTSSDVPLFFNRKVVKPVKGGGKGIPTVDPYSGGTVAIKPQPLSFQDFQSK